MTSQALTRAARILSLFCVLLWESGSHALWSQLPEGPLPEEYSLQTPSLYKDPVMVAAIFKPPFDKDKEPQKALTFYKEVYFTHARSGNFENQALAAMHLAELCLNQGQFTEAVNWATRASSLDSLFAPLSPPRQYLMNSLGGFYSSFGAWNNAIQYLRESVRISVARDKVPMPRLFRCITNLAGAFENAGLRDSSLFYYQEALRVAEATRQEYWHASALNNYGFALKNQNQPDSALVLLNLALAKFLKSGLADSTFHGAIIDNIGQTLMMVGRTEEARILFEDNLRRFSEVYDPMRQVSAGMRSAEALIRLGRLEEARGRMAEVAAMRGQVVAGLQSRTQQEWMNLLIHEREAAGDWKQAAHLRERMIAQLDSINRDSKVARTQAMDHFIEEKTAAGRRELELLESKHAESSARARYRGILILFLMVMGLGTAVFLLTIQRRRIQRIRIMAERQRLRRTQAELRLQQEQAEKDLIHRTLELKERDIADLALDLSLKRQVAAELLERLKAIKASANPVAEVQDMIHTLRRQTENEVQTRLTQENINLVNHAFYEKLRQRFPSLTASEVDLCGLLRMRLSSKDIADLRNISVHSVRVSKYRLKKKLGLGKEEDLARVLQEL